MIPTAIVDRYETHAPFDQSPGEQAALAECVATISIAEGSLFIFDGKRFAGSPGKDHLGSPLLILVVGDELVVALHALGEAVDGIQKRLSPGHAQFRERLWCHEIAHAIVGFVGVACLERFVSSAQERTAA